MGLLIALAVTLLVECGLAAVQSRDLKWVLYVALINVVTNPIVNIILLAARNFISPGGIKVLTYALEVLVVFVEGILIYKLRASSGFKVRKLTFQRSLLYAFNINCVSYLVGLLIF